MISYIRVGVLISIVYKTLQNVAVKMRAEYIYFLFVSVVKNHSTLKPFFILNINAEN